MASPTIPVVPSGFFVFRSPLLPMSEWVAWGSGLEAPAHVDDALRLEGALASDRHEVRARLVAAVARPEVREALFLASPSTEGSLQHWLTAPDSEYGQKVERTIVRYFSRMASRSTPFGLFSGCSVGMIGTTTRLIVADRASYQRHTRLDMAYLCKLTDALASDPRVTAHVRYKPSSSLYTAAGRLRYAEAHVGDVRSYGLVAVEPNELLDAMLARAATQPHGATVAELAHALVELDPEIAPEDAERFIAELVASQLLSSELAPCVTGPEAIHGLIAQLREHDTTIAAQLEKVRDELSALDAAPLGASPRVYLDIARSLEALPCKLELPRLFQVDMVKPAPDATLSRNVVDAIRSTVLTLQRIAPAPPTNPLDNFRDAFEARFEQQAVPLLVALDDEAGIGYGSSGEVSPLLDTIPFETAVSAARSFTPHHVLLLAKLQEAQARGARTIVLAEADLEQLENPAPPPLPASFSIMATLGARSTEALAAGDFQLYFKGASWGVSLLGRFCHADLALHEHV
ncbi:MAG TPA: lantibiotic dehydratase family protein, partial [Kofleriaceae bacterium]